MSEAILQHGVDLRPWNTFGLTARARAFAVVGEVGQLASLLPRHRRDMPCLVLGGGSNIVLTRDFDGLVLHVAIRGRERLSEDADYRYVRAGAGENWHDFVRWTLAQGWPGLENLSLIPGTVGAAPIQNIGAYGLEVAERFDSLEAVSLADGTIHRFVAEQCEFGYRDSVFKRVAAGRFVITSVTFRLPKRWRPVVRYAALATELTARGLERPSPQEVSDAVIAIRRRKLPDPQRLGNAGSFFKNPVVDAGALAALRRRYPDVPAHARPDGRHKLAAGWLIDRCGWRGRALGAVGCFEKQALVLVNRGGATGEEVRRMAEAIQRDVAERFGIALEPEPVFI